MDQDDAAAHPLPPARDLRKFQRDFVAGDVLFDQGAQGASMFVVLEGSVRIEDRRPSPPAPIAERGPGEFFGEMALVNSGIRGATAVAAATPTRVVEIDRARFIYLVSQQPAFALTVMRELCRRIPMPDTI